MFCEMYPQINPCYLGNWFLILSALDTALFWGFILGLIFKYLKF